MIIAGFFILRAGLYVSERPIFLRISVIPNSDSGVIRSPVSRSFS